MKYLHLLFCLLVLLYQLKFLKPYKYQMRVGITALVVMFRVLLNFYSMLFCLIEGKLQYCVGFCHTTIQSAIIIHTSLPSQASLLSPNPTPLGHHRASGWAPCVIQQLLTSYIFYTRQCIYVDATFSIRTTLSFPHCVHKAVSTSASPFLPCKQVHQYHFSRFHLYALVCNVRFFILTYFTLFNRLYIHSHHQN